MLRSLAATVAEKGYSVHIFASLPSYRGVSKDKVPSKEVDGTVNIHRGRILGSERSGIVVRSLNSLVYCFGLFNEVLKLRPDVVTAATFPPVFAAWTASLAAKIVGAKFIYHMQDIHPEVSQISGGLMSKSVVNRLVKWFDNQTLRRSHVVVVLSEDMANTLANRNVRVDSLRVINNPPVEQESGVDLPPQEYRKDPGKIRLIFAGNLGRFQNLELLASGISKCFKEYPKVELVFLGDGSAEPELKRRWLDHPQVKFYPFLPYLQARELIAEADVGVVSLQEGICSVSFPSKVSTYINLGIPIFVLTEVTSELAKITRTQGLGVVPENMSPDAIYEALRVFLNGDATLAGSARKWFEANWSVDANSQAWLQLLTECCERSEIPS
jgi:glycosyltransferase involved in cell wall biosynthesis